jgi:hypothetical protein
MILIVLITLFNTYNKEVKLMANKEIKESAKKGKKPKISFLFA